MELANEIFVPAHAAVWRRLVRLAGQAAAMNQNYPYTNREHRLHITHIQLVDRDMPRLPVSTCKLGRRLHNVAAHEEAAMALRINANLDDWTADMS
jgi:hypothetical protein